MSLPTLSIRSRWLTPFAMKLLRHCESPLPAAGRIAVARDLDSRLVGTARLLASGQLNRTGTPLCTPNANDSATSKRSWSGGRSRTKGLHQTPGQLRRSVRRATVRVSPLTVADEVEGNTRAGRFPDVSNGAVIVTIGDTSRTRWDRRLERTDCLRSGRFTGW